MSDSNAVVLRYVAETTYDETPVDADWKTIPWNSESFTATVDTVTSNRVRQDRARADMPKVGLTVSGGFDYEFSALTFDDFFEAALGGTWAQDGVNLWDILEQGTTYRSFSVEKEFSDLTTPEFVQLSGQRVGSISLSLAFGSIVTGTIGMAGAGAVTSQTSLVGAGSTAPVPTTEIMNASSDFGSLEVDGVPSTICLTALDFTIENNLRAINCIGSDTPKDQRMGTCDITGSMTAYMSNDSFEIYKKALSNADASLKYSLTDGTNSFEIFLPRIKLSGDTPQAGGLDQDVEVTLSFTALQDEVEGTPIRLKRTPNVV